MALTVVASRYGWSAVSETPMDWYEFSLARQLLAEERVGTRVREAEEREDAAFAAAKAALSRG